MTDTILRRRDDESFNQFHVRLFDNKDEYGIDKYEIADILNAEMGSNYDESKWRKDYAQYCKWRDFLVTQNLDKEIVKKHEELRIEAEKEKVRRQDQRREYKKLINNQARFEQLRDEILIAVKELQRKKPLKFNPKEYEFGNKEGLVLFSDWHYGIEVNNSFNKFNKEIFNQRVQKLVDRTIEHGRLHKIDRLHIGQLGDLVSGILHVSTRVQSNEDVIRQIKYVSEVLAEVISRLANEFKEIKFYNVIGNHGRTGRKDETGIKENFEYLIPWYLESRLSKFDNVEIVSDEDGMVLASICGEPIVFTHGNFDRAERSVTQLPQLLGYVPKYIISGHVHHNFEKEFGVTTSIVNGCLVGLDDHAVQGRYGGKPSQKFIIFDKNEGLECTYIIKLN